MPRTDHLRLPDVQLIKNIEREIAQRGWQEVRASILSIYHQRLAEILVNPSVHKRPKKLSASELNTLALCFVARLIELQQDNQDTEERIKCLCKSETELLEKGYPRETIAKNHYPLYINLVKDAIAKEKITLNEQNSYSFDIYKQTGELETITAHYANLYLKYDREFYRQVKRQSNERNNIKQDSPKPVHLYPYLEKLELLLKSETYTELTVGIAAATGRRFSEIIERGTFTIPFNPNSPYELEFSGQLKKTKEAPAYTTYSIVPARLVVAALNKLRAMPKIKVLAGASIQKINTLLPTVNYQVKRHFHSTGIVEVLEGEAGVTIHNLRAIYGEISAHFFCESRSSFPRFLCGQLGHLIEEEKVNANLSPSTEHYFHYYLVDKDGTTINEMGVKLKQADGDTEFDTEFIKQAEQFLSSNNPWCQLTGVIALTGTPPDGLLKHFVFKGVQGKKIIHYTHQVHPPHTPPLRLVTLADSTKILDTITILRNHPLLKPYLDTHVGKDINGYVRERIADYLGQLGVETYSLAISVYQRIISSFVMEIEEEEEKKEKENKESSLPATPTIIDEFKQLSSILKTDSEQETLLKIIELAKIALSNNAQPQEDKLSEPIAVIQENPTQPLVESFSEDNGNNATSPKKPQSPGKPAPTPQPRTFYVNALNNVIAPFFNGDPQSSWYSMTIAKKLDEFIDTAKTLISLYTQQPVIHPVLQTINPTPSHSSEPENLPQTPTPQESATNNQESADTPQSPLKNTPKSPLTDHRRRNDTPRRINQAIDALMKYNQHVAHSLRWYISAPVLKELAGGAQVSINSALKERSNELEKHHQSLDIKKQHNRSFHREHSVTDFVTLEF
ncbi:hypothetical protein PCC7424_5888 (plasmid) [Gloeothece citriformis PCC 7424]|uniref:Telomere resolvase ResT/TelK catalytic domain-containing protein n=1 Tax=Gloeothece citriformis (strain PCC 7424) TaxID=65393 RepID=B7KMB3_GLOC7|nr:protelomerase family protein [Gloeothece citriformis]ACK73935.1 hypothetical protein PCC7424_5888 [Gloeothece citriformis PCC 7424]